MRPSEFFERYCRESHLEFFRGEDLPADVPQRPGLYAWYARATLPRPDGARLEQELPDLLRKLVLERYRRQPYQVTLHAPLEPRFEGVVTHQMGDPVHANLPPDLARRVGEAVFGFLSRSFVPAFSAPIYVGLAARQSLAARISQHLRTLQIYLDRSDDYLRSQREALLDGGIPGDSEDMDAHTFGLEAAMRRFAPDRLFLATFSPPDASPETLHATESVVNRIGFPICGRR